MQIFHHGEKKNYLREIMLLNEIKKSINNVNKFSNFLSENYFNAQVNVPV